MSKKFLLLLFIVSTVIFADNNTTDSNITNPFPEAVIVKHGIVDAVDENDTENWNTQNWKNYFEKQGGVDVSAIGNTQALIGGSKESQTAFRSNPNELTSDVVKDNSDFSQNQAIQNGWNSSIQQSVLSQSVSNPFLSVLDISESLQCYITRDISFRWKCLESGLIYGGAMNESGKAARLQCDNDCFEQKTCINLNPAPVNSWENISGVSCDFSKDTNCTITKTIDSSKLVKTIEVNFDEATIIGDEYLVDVNLKRSDNTNREVIKNLRRTFIDGNLTINVQDNIKSLEVIVKRYKDNNTTTANIDDVVVNYKKDNKYICRTLQNIESVDGGEFGYTCSSGDIVTFNVNGRTYKICNDGGLGADNSDGTFSTESSCLSACKIAKECKSDFTTFTTGTLNTFREGCIEGTPGCSNENEDCKASRLKNDVILNETVFDATANKRITIQNSVQIKGQKRPRIDPGEDWDFERRNQEEWKDEAFKEMAINHKYGTVKFPIGEQNEAKNSYRLGLTSGAAYGHAGEVIRAISWNLKPKTFDVNDGRNYYFYALLVADFGYHEHNLMGELEKKRKQIWYIKTSANDTFKPIKIGYDLGFSGLDENNNTVALETVFSSLEDKTFAGNSWVGISPNQSAEYFLTQKLENNSLPFWNIPVVSNIGNLIYALPGIVRRVERSAAAYDQYFYTGNFDGTGDGLLTFSLYTYYSNEQLTYNQLYAKIQNKEMPKIYKMGEEYLYPTKLEDDVENSEMIQLYQYGTPDKTDLAARIFPRREDVGKKGFIFVFIQ